MCAGVHFFREARFYHKKGQPQSSSDSLMVDEGGFPGVMVVEFYSTAATVGTDDG